MDIMILVDMSDLELKAYAQQLSYMTYDFNMDHNLDIKPIAKSEAHFNKWIVNYPFYSNIHKEGIILYKENTGAYEIGIEEKMAAFKELVVSTKEKSKYLSDDFDPDKELEESRKERYKNVIL